MTTQNAMPTTPYLLDDVWVEAIEEALATPASLPFAIEPEVMAVYTVMMGQPLQPELWYRTVKDCEMFIVTYKAATAAWADKVSEVNASLGSKPVAIDYQAELDDLVESMFEAEFMRSWH